MFFIVLTIYEFIYIMTHMMNSVQELLEKDCNEHGFGRKAWWAKQLGVPPLTISHWLAGRQKPNGQHTRFILDVLQEETATQNFPIWINFLWESYFKKTSLEPHFLESIIPLIFQTKSLSTRTLAFLSFITGKFKLSFMPALQATSKLKNRLGWLMEVSNLSASFEPKKRTPDFLVSIFESLDQSADGKNYLLKQQTQIGKKWSIYDCDLSAIKRKFL